MGIAKKSALVLAFVLVTAACGDGDSEDTTTTGQGNGATITSEGEVEMNGSEYPWVKDKREQTADVEPPLSNLEFKNGNTRQNPCSGCETAAVDSPVPDGVKSSEECGHPVLYVQNQLIAVEEPSNAIEEIPLRLSYDGESVFQLPDSLRLWSINGDPISFLLDNPDFAGFPNYVYMPAPSWKFSPASEKVVLNDSKMEIDGTPFAGGKVAIVDDFSSGSGHGQFISDLVRQLTGEDKPTDYQFDVQLNQVDENNSVVGPWPHKGDTPSVLAAVGAARAAHPDAVVNLSMGTYACEANEKAFLPVSLGTGLVAAAGNDAHDPTGPNEGPVFYPAGFPGVIGVGAVGWHPEDNRWYAADFSNTVGAEAWAPGVSIVAHDGVDIVAWSGTSFASPHYAACLAAGACSS